MNNTTEMVLILDRSASMHGLEEDTIGGFNSMVEKQREENINAMITVALFDDRTEIPFDRVSLKDIPMMDRNIYFTRGCTALYDAVGRMIMRVKKHRAVLSEAEIPGKTVFVITTDGLENASCEFSNHDIQRLIEQQKETGWEFLFLGANIDAAEEAEKIGIRANRAVRYHADHRGTRKNFDVLADALCSYCLQKNEVFEEDWADDINADYMSRKRDERE